MVTPQDIGNGTLSYAVTVIKLAVQTNLGSTPTVAQVAQAILIQFIKKKKIALEMLRKELQERMELQEQSAQTAAALAQMERMQNFYNGAKKALEVQQIEKGKLEKLMNA